MHENETQNQNHQQNSSSQAQNHQTTGKNEFQTIGRLFQIYEGTLLF